MNTEDYISPSEDEFWEEMQEQERELQFDEDYYENDLDIEEDE